jgi:hypothetical protein
MAAGIAHTAGGPAGVVVEARLARIAADAGADGADHDRGNRHAWWSFGSETRSAGRRAGRASIIRTL